MMKKLNNKGFTLIELLAVIVILAVVMAIAARSVLGVMSNSKKSSLNDSAISAKRSFDNAYAEYAVTQDGTIVGFTGTDFDANGRKNMTKAAFDELGISSKDYELDTSDPITNTGNYSFVYFKDNQFIVCLVATPNGSFYDAKLAGKNSDTGVTGSNLTGMWACSNGNNSWTTTS